MAEDHLSSSTKHGYIAQCRWKTLFHIFVSCSSFFLLCNAFEFEWQNNTYSIDSIAIKQHSNSYSCHDAKAANNALLTPSKTNEILAHHVSLIEAADETTGIGAKCLDGSPAAYYYRPTPGITTHTNDISSLLAPRKYFIYLQGGSWCSPAYGHHMACGWDDCYSRSLTSSGSTACDNKYLKLSNNDRAYLSTNPSINPLTFNWNVAYTRYCDGGSYSNNLYDPVIIPNKNLSIYFRGHRNLIAILDDLLHNKGMMNATDIIIGGCSSGALAVYLNIDFISEYVEQKTGNSNIKIMGMADSGFFYNYNSAANFSNAMKYLYNSQNLSVNRYCIRQYGNNKQEYFNCVYAQNVTPYIKTKIFSSQSQHDDWQIYCDLNNENRTLINEYGENIAKSYVINFTATSVNNNHCGYLSSCRYHCGWYNITVAQTVFDFYHDNNIKNFYFDNETYSC